MVRIIWTKRAVADVEAVRRYVGQFDPAAAERLAGRLVDAGNGLIDFPDRGRPAAHGCRALTTVRPYIILYEVLADDILILSIRHGAQIAERD